MMYTKKKTRSGKKKEKKKGRGRERMKGEKKREGVTREGDSEHVPWEEPGSNRDFRH